MPNVWKSNGSHFILLANIITGEDCYFRDCSFPFNFRKHVTMSMKPQQKCDTNFIKSVNVFRNTGLPLSYK